MGAKGQRASGGEALWLIRFGKGISACPERPSPHRQIMPEGMIYPTWGERGVVSEREGGGGTERETLFLSELTVHPGRILEPEPEPGTSLEAYLF